MAEQTQTLLGKFGEHFQLAQVAERLANASQQLLAALIVFFVFWVIARILSEGVARVARRKNAAAHDTISLLARAIRLIIYVIGAISALGTAGVNVSALVASLGLTGFALGFAFKDALSNILAGVMILLYRPFRRGDRIAVSGVEGAVAYIDLRYTCLEGPEKSYLIPNANLLANVITLENNNLPKAVADSERPPGPGTV